ncbi:bifunctional amino acid aminotransferase/2-hydroxyacid dehydrogenase [Lentilactobacillus kefiri]|uniref:Lactate dehydrogenase n=1 Tax=Lentilactobacillus kefiri TaxID=33962 RepID=A0A511DW10_LENKE|nr:bifunctional amino acid aminotransferase/2-hydroxyacid dehydrogenase [Lentilactobacillus kefiri]PAK81719.1 bifunctional amino acid aminotransferase/2-hydroxyacid dehydrogenase [Lentilactobacillus kefiri]PAL05621.1 bifunctional amino acid aminotransferase/2-hydroxyacid dehydrogenase [Lentilactobacillus kefiri]QGV24430.1 D-2-hydroxyacid dehydrogenase [Lentilactobacillus kefiri]GEL29032.1 lactate dehydrogenase [Lentilactobacillus kefiri]
MKILMYNVRPDEQKPLNEWVKQNGIQVDTNSVPLSTETVDLAKGYDGIVIQQHGPISDPSIYEKLHSFGIKQITLRITGFEIIDLDQAKKNDLVVTNVPAYSPRSVSELVLADVMGLLRHIGEVQEREKHGDFSWKGIEAREIHTLTVGIIGAGKIGSAVARIFRALGATVIAADPVHRPELNDTLTYVDHDTVFKTADIVTMHTPLTDETNQMITADVFKKMKPTAIFINASRGQVVDTGALVSALENKEISAAAIDTFEGENTIVGQDLTGKQIDNDNLKKLLAMPNVNVTPHIGFYTEVAVQNMIEISLNDVVTILNGQKSPHEVGE